MPKKLKHTFKSINKGNLNLEPIFMEQINRRDAACDKQIAELLERKTLLGYARDKLIYHEYEMLCVASSNDTIIRAQPTAADEEAMVQWEPEVRYKNATAKTKTRNSPDEHIEINKLIETAVRQFAIVNADLPFPRDLAVNIKVFIGEIDIAVPAMYTNKMIVSIVGHIKEELAQRSPPGSYSLITGRLVLGKQSHNEPDLPDPSRVASELALYSSNRPDHSSDLSSDY